MNPQQAQDIIRLLKYVQKAVENQEINIGDINVNLDSLEDLLKGIGGNQETVSIIRASGAGSIAAGTLHAHVRNMGAANVTVAGGILKPGEGVPLVPKVGNTLAAVAYDATGSDLLIVTHS